MHLGPESSTRRHEDSGQEPGFADDRSLGYLVLERARLVCEHECGGIPPREGGTFARIHRELGLGGFALSDGVAPELRERLLRGAQELADAPVEGADDALTAILALALHSDRIVTRLSRRRELAVTRDPELAAAAEHVVRALELIVGVIGLRRAEALSARVSAAGQFDPDWQRRELMPRALPALGVA
jgi:hypothetical protein